MKQRKGSRIAIISGARTPFAKVGTVLRRRSALELGVHAVNGAVEMSGLDPEAVEELQFGIVVVTPRIPQFAREVCFASRLPASVRALTLVDNCITGISAVSALSDSLRDGRAVLGIAGGVESMSNPAVLFRERASRIFVDMANARGMRERLALAARLRPGDFIPEPPAIAEPSTGLSMGEHCELMVKEWKISRQTQDEIALRSHQRAHAATQDGRLRAEIHPLDGTDRDTLIRPDTTLERLAALKPIFDPSPSGTITAGTSSPLTDGAAAVMLTTEARAEREGFAPLAFIRDVEFAAIDPKDGLLMAPAVAVPRLLERNKLKLEKMDIVEMHEAFAGQVACNLKAWAEGWKERAIGEVDAEILNPLGSSIAVGHPFGATGIRIVLTLANELKRRNARFGLISVCGAGATAAAMILERS
ncbi:MAG: acetyl-CoA C-acyltransferase [Gammaproteobacteria bacterium]|nr:acetyl-CoA C-acyltransferase [Gammaproteobacteria bacterium]MDH3411201.1 acetyl-CoA C-acyltransferase [Gammaproteobacteria bacterium]